MKKFKKMMGLVLACVMMLGLAITANAATISIESGSTDADATTETTSYTYYQFLEADIGEDAKVDEDSGVISMEGNVAYYVEKENLAEALKDTQLFTVTKVANQDRWNVILNNPETTATEIAEALNKLNKSLAITQGTFSQTEPGGTAKSGELKPGYYLIVSSLGTELAVQTLSDVTIKEKNDYPSIDKYIDVDGDYNTKEDLRDQNDVNIGDTVYYSVPVVISANAAEKEIVITDKMYKGLTLQLNTLEDDKGLGLSFGSGQVEGDYNVYTITIPEEKVKALAGQTVTFTYQAKLNAEAIVDGDGNINKVNLKYDNYTTQDHQVVTKTYDYSIKKIDGNTRDDLTGAEFTLYKTYDEETKTGSDPVYFVEVEGGYRVATDDEETTTTTISAGKIELKGLGAGTYYLVETKAPEGGYNILDEPKEVIVTETTGKTEDTFDQTIENKKGSTLPSTGGIGTTIFYIVGAILVIGAGIILVARRRMKAE